MECSVGGGYICGRGRPTCLVEYCHHYLPETLTLQQERFAELCYSLHLPGNYCRIQTMSLTHLACEHYTVQLLLDFNFLLDIDMG